MKNNTQLGVAAMMTVAMALFGLWTFDSVASAQATSVRSDGFRQSDIDDRSLLNRGRMELMLNMAGALSLNHTASGERQLAAFANPAVGFGYMATDRLAIRGDVGYRHERVAQGGERLQNLHAVSVTAQAVYHAPLRYGLALYGGVGLGGFYGVTARPQGANEFRTNPTAGGIAQGLAGILIQPGPSFMLRAGIRVEGTYGFEWTENDSVSAGNLRIGGEMAIGFRFGGR